MYFHLTILDIVFCYWHDVLDFCGDVFFFLFGSVKFCILLCNSTFFYALKYVIIQDWVTLGIFYSVLRSRITICLILWSCIMLMSYTAWHSVNKNEMAKQGNGHCSQPRCYFLPSAVKNGGQCRLSCCSQKPSSQCVVWYFETVKVGKWWLGHPWSCAIQTRLSV